MLELDVSIRVAVTTSMASYIIAGFIGSVTFARHNSLDIPALLKFSVGAGPAALAGSFALQIGSDNVLRYCSYGLITMSACFALRQV